MLYKAVLEWTKRGTVIIDAKTPGEAEVIAENDCLVLTDEAEPHSEITDWEVVTVVKEKI